MSKIKKYLILTALFIILICTVSFIKSKEYSTQTSLEISAPVNFVFNAIQDLKHHQNWNVKASSDTLFLYQCMGNSAGEGATCDYQSTQYGTGIWRILDVHLDSSVSIADEQPGTTAKVFVYTCMKKDSVTTRLQITGSSKSGFISNLWNFIHQWKLRKMMNRNLDNLKIFVLNRYKNKVYQGYQIQELYMNPRFFLASRSVVDSKLQHQYYTNNISSLYQLALKNNLTISGMPCGLYFNRDETETKTDMAAALQTLAEIQIPGVESITLPAGKAIITEFQGDISKIQSAHLALQDYMLDHKWRAEPPIIEEYLTDPAKEPDQLKWKTHVIYYVTNY